MIMRGIIGIWEGCVVFHVLYGYDGRSLMREWLGYAITPAHCFPVSCVHLCKYHLGVFTSIVFILVIMLLHGFILGA